MSDDFSYVGGELGLFAHAHNWKRYWFSRLKPHIRGDVLEAGAGIGTNTALLQQAEHRSWTCMEPDASLATQLKAATTARVIVGTIESIPAGELFDTILYIDVLEHIPDDAAELSRAASRLRPGGRVIVLSPAHQWLFSEFDKSIGHCRRYTRGTLLAVTPPSLKVVQCIYLDAVGLFASLGNRLLLKQSLPTVKQIHVWDRLMVPPSRLIDPLLFRRVGKTVVGIWEKY
jgi:SAM-dependent methyltransferase